MEESEKKERVKKENRRDEIRERRKLTQGSDESVFTIGWLCESPRWNTIFNGGISVRKERGRQESECQKGGHVEKPEVVSPSKISFCPRVLSSDSLVSLVTEDSNRISRFGWSPNGCHCQIWVLLSGQGPVRNLVRRSDVLAFDVCLYITLLNDLTCAV